MDILVVGTGNIGTLYGWALADAGHPVTHLVRPGSAARPAEALLDVLDERSGRDVHRLERYAWHVTDAVPPEADLVLLAMPASSVAAAVSELAPRLPGATFVTWALEWDAVELGGLIAAERLVVGYPDSGGTRTADWRYVLSLGAHPHLGLRAGTGSAERLEGVLGVLRSAGFAPEVHDPFEPWLRVHAALTVPYWVALDRHRDLHRFLADGALLRSAFRASHEVLRLCEALGADLDAFDEVATARIPAWLFPFAFRMLYRTNEGMRRATGHAVAGIDEGLELSRQVLRTADRLGVPMAELRRLAGPDPDRSAGVEPRPTPAGPTLS